MNHGPNGERNAEEEMPRDGMRNGNRPENPPLPGLEIDIPSRIGGLIFDCDGTLADSMPLHWQAWQSIIARHRFQFSEERFYALGGIPSRDILAALNSEQGLSLDALAVAREKETAYIACISQIRPIDPVLAIARNNFGRLPMAVASGGTREIIRTVLKHLGILELFQVIVTHEDVTRQKPAPDIFLEAARRMGIPPQACRAYEDTDMGVRAIRAAGMECVDVRQWLPQSLPCPPGS